MEKSRLYSMGTEALGDFAVQARSRGFESLRGSGHGRRSAKMYHRDGMDAVLQKCRRAD